MPTTKGTKTKADIGKELAQLRDSYLQAIHQIQQRDRLVEEVISLLVEKQKTKDIYEIEYTEDELFAKYKPLIGLYGIDKETNEIVKIISVVNNWTVVEVKPPATEGENPLYIFKNKENDEDVREIYANGGLEAWTTLRKIILADKAIPVETTEDKPTPKMEIVK